MGCWRWVGQWDINKTSASIESEIQDRESLAVGQIQTSVAAIFDDLRERARMFAASEELIDAFRSLQAHEGDAESVVNTVSGLDLNERDFIEVYDPAPRLLAWDGAVFPVDQGVNQTGFMTEELADVVKDGARRTAFVVWVLGRTP